MLNPIKEFFLKQIAKKEREIKNSHEFVYKEAIDPPRMLDESKVTSLLLKNFPNLVTLKAFQNKDNDTDIKSLTSSQ